jgi:hypothetical protein
MQPGKQHFCFATYLMEDAGGQQFQILTIGTTLISNRWSYMQKETARREMVARNAAIN